MQAPVHVNPGFGQGVQLHDQSGGIDHHSRPDHRMLAGTQNAARNQLKDKTAAVEDDSVAGVVATRAARDVVKGCGEIVDDLALPLVAPLRPYHDNRLHRPLAPCSNSRFYLNNWTRKRIAAPRGAIQPHASKDPKTTDSS